MTLRPIASVTLAALALAGCPGHIDDPAAFLGPTGDASLVSCTIGASSVEAQIIRPRCATAMCHERGMPAGRLDLESPNVGARLVGVASTCAGQLLVSPTSPGTSYLLQKLGTSSSCGARMPLGAPALTPSEVACVRLWVDRLLTDGGAPMDASADATADAPDLRDAVDVTDARDASDVADAADAADAMDAMDDAADAGGMDGGDAMDASDDAADAGDAGADAPGDAPGDARDAAPDAPADAPSDARDATADAPADVPRDASGDAAADAPADAPRDAPGDAADGGADAPAD
ncbi:MAG: hypothetical protein U0324_32805 [Polyangiales bacterium]